MQSEVPTSRRSSGRIPKAPKNYIPTMAAAKKWSDNGTTGIKVTSVDIEKKRKEWKLKLEKARDKKYLARGKCFQNDRAVRLIQDDISRLEWAKSCQRSLDWPLYRKFQRANSKYKGLLEEHAYFLHNLVRDKVLQAEDVDSIAGSDMTCPMSPTTYEDEFAVYEESSIGSVDY